MNVLPEATTTVLRGLRSPVSEFTIFQVSVVPDPFSTLDGELERVQLGAPGGGAVAAITRALQVAEPLVFDVVTVYVVVLFTGGIILCIPDIQRGILPGMSNPVRLFVSVHERFALDPFVIVAGDIDTLQLGSGTTARSERRAKYEK